jgi:glutaconate CoA-transferase, subunit B
MAGYNKIEMMICTAARFLEDGKTVAVGTGAPCAAAMLAQKLNAPNLVIIFEAGGLAPLLPQMPISVGDSRTFFRGIMAAGMNEMMTTCSRGLVDYAFLGGAQIDKYGNINSTVIGDYYSPKVRFPGSGGANDFASFCWQTMIIAVQNKTRFVESVDFVTSPGFLSGPGEREKAGLPAGGGPYKIITDLAVMGFHPDSKKMMIESIHQGVELNEVLQNTGFKPIIPEKIDITAAPSEAELRILREEVDPHKFIIGRQ